MTRDEALLALHRRGGSMHYISSGFGDDLRASLCRADFVEMDYRGRMMQLTELGRILAAKIIAEQALSEGEDQNSLPQNSRQ